MERNSIYSQHPMKYFGVWLKRMLIVILGLIAVMLVWNIVHQDCFYRVSKTGNVYSPHDRYWSLTSYKTDLCFDEAIEISNQIENDKR